jgi:hypothetical protein
VDARPPLAIREGVRVLSSSQFLRGPSGVQFLADLGAHVIGLQVATYRLDGAPVGTSPTDLASMFHPAPYATGGWPFEERGDQEIAQLRVDGAI